MPRAAKDRTPASSRSGSPSTRPLAAQKPKIPLICWDGDCAYRTTKLLDWCLENETARVKIFSDSTQEAKDAGRKKEVSSHPKGYYLQQAASAIFANDPNDQIQELSKTHPGEFVSRISRRLKDLRAQYNKANEQLGQTGAGLTYDELQNNSRMRSIIDDVITSFLWWPTLHGFWQTNPIYNTFFSTSDPGQDFEGEALAELTQEKPSGASSTVDSGASSPALDLATLYARADTPNSNTNTSLEMDIDDYDSLYGPPGLSLAAPPAPINPSPPPALLSHAPSGSHTPARGCGQSPIPFSFCGGAPCITASKPRENVYSLNSDDEGKRPRLHTIGRASPPPIPPIHREPKNITGSSDLDSSPAVSQLSTDSRHHRLGAAGSASTQLTSPGSSSNTARRLSKQRKLPADIFADNIVQSMEKLLQGIQLKQSKHEEKRSERDAKYGDRAKTREYNRWLVRGIRTAERSEVVRMG